MSLHLFTGDHGQALQDKLRFWQLEFIKKHGEANLEKFEDLNQGDIGRIISAFQTEPFLGERRMVIIHGLPAGTETGAKLETESLEEAIAEAAESAVIIFVSAKPDKRSRLYKLLVKLAGIESFMIPQGRELGAWVEQRFQAQDKTISPRARDLFLMMTSQDISHLPSEIEKLCLLDEETISEKTIETYVTPTPEAKIWKTLDLIGGGSSAELLKNLEQLTRSGEEMAMIFYMIVRQFRLLTQIRALIDAGAGSDVLQRRLKLAPFQVAPLLRQARYFTLKQLKNTYRRLTEIDLQLKTGKVSLSGGDEELLHLRVDQLLCSLAE